MARGPSYRRPLRRRSEGKTNYQKRLRLLKSRKLRCVIRASNNHMVVQIIDSKFGGDKILISAHSKELSMKFDWKANTGNIPAAYLTGYLAGLRAKKKGISEAILDLGVFYHIKRVLASFKGVIDAGIEIPHDEDFFPVNLKEKINGLHIEEYAKKLKSDDPERYEQIFSGYINKNKINPQKLSQNVSNTLKSIKSKV